MVTYQSLLRMLDLVLMTYVNNTQFTHNKQMKIELELTFDEVYQMNKFYDTILDMGLTDDLPKEIETVFDKIREAEIDSLKSGT